MSRLVTRRRTGQSLKIGDDIRLTVMESNNYSTLLSIDAPKSVLIRKEEEPPPAEAEEEP